MNSKGQLYKKSTITGRLHLHAFVMALLITSSWLGLARPALAQTCAFYPIAVSSTSLSNAVPGVTVLDIYNGAGSGQFGWLSWGGSPSEPTLVASLTPPGNSTSYVNPDNPEDHQISIGDWISSKPGVSNSKKVRDALDALTSVDITIPVWDLTRGTGDKAAYRVSGFAVVRILSYHLPQQNRISARFLGLTSCGQQNVAPTVSAGADQTITLPSGVTLNGTASDDGLPVGSALTVIWSQVSGPGTTAFVNTNLATTTATFSAPGTYLLRLTASDSQLSSSDDIVITVNRENQAPVADSRSVATDEDVAASVVLTGSDPDGDALTYVIVTQPSFGALSGTPPNIVYTPKPDYHGLDEFTFRVNDGLLDSGVATVTITNRPVNDAPVADGRSLSTDEDTPLNIALSGSDIEGGTLTYVLVSNPTNGTLSGTVPNVIYTPAINFHGGDSFSFRVNDGQLDSVPVQITLTVVSVNDAPIVDAGQNGFISLPTNSVALAGAVSDDYYFETNYLLTEWTMMSGPGTVTFGNSYALATTATFSASGIYTLRLTASDGLLEDYDDVVVTVNIGPTVNAGGDVTVTYPASAPLMGVASDDGIPTNSTLAVTWSKVSGPGTAFFSDAQSTNTAASFSEGGVYVLRLTGTDSAVEAADEITVTVNKAPIVDAGSDQLVTNLTAALSGSIADDGIGQIAAMWSKVSGPGAVAFSTNAAIATATFSESGIYTLRLAANDSYSETSDDVVITVDGAPVVSAGADQVVNFPAGATLSGAADDDGLPTNGLLSAEWSQVSGPGSATFVDSHATNTSVTFSASGTYVLRLTATDSLLSAGDEVTVTANLAPVVDAGSDQVVTELQAVLQGTVSDDGLPTNSSFVLTWGKVSGPGSVTFSANQANATVVFSQVGNYVLQLTASDGSAVGSDEVAIRVNSAPVASNQSLTTDEDTALPLTLQGSDADGDNLTYQVVVTPQHGTLTGVAPNLSYVPVANYAGSDSIAFRVNDGFVNSSLGTIQITVQAVNDAPVAVPQTVATVEDTAGLLTLAATDVDGDALSFTVVTQPAHGSLSGTAPNLTYLPNANYSGQDSFTFAANDGFTNSLPVTVSISITPVNDPPTADAGADLVITRTEYLGTNLLLNPGNEAALVGGNITNWVEVSGTNWTRANTNTFGTTPSLEGATYFTPGATALAELRQDVNCAAYATQIDAGVQSFQFKGYARVKNEPRPDAAKFVVEYRDAANAQILDQVVFPECTEASAWQLFQNVRTAPVGTRWLRVRLMGELRYPSSSTCDTYFDALSLTALNTSTVILSGQVSDDGLPTNSTLTTTWTQLTGPGQAHLQASNAPATPVILSTSGVYTFRLEASDGELSTNDTVQVTVQNPAGNQPPQAFAGVDQTITLPANNVSLAGSVTDDGLPTNAEVRHSWSVASGEGSVVFDNPTALVTKAYFDQAGTYTLRLSADDGQLIASDEVTVFVNCATLPAPLDIALVIDESGSMYGQKLADAKAAATGLVQNIAPVKDLVWVVSFDFIGRLRAGPTSYRPQLEAGIAKMGSPGITLISTGVEMATQELLSRGRTNVATQVMILLSDGIDPTASTNLTAQARSAGIRVISIGLGTDANDQLMRAAASSKADYYFASNSTVLPALFQRLGVALCRPQIQNSAPLVDAGLGASLRSTNEVLQLEGSSVDDGLPLGLLNTRWQKLSGPGDVTFGNATNLHTTAAFSQPGDYVLTLTADDGYEFTTDGIRVRVGMTCQVQTDASIAAWWTMDGGVQDCVHDSLTAVAPRTYDYPRFAPGMVGGSLIFDGTNEFVRVPAGTNSEIQSADDGFTVEFWMKPDSFKNAGVLGWTNGVRIEQSFLVGAGNSLRVRLSGTGASDPSSGFIWTGSTGFNWAHVAVTYDRARAEARIYANGSLMGTATNIAATNVLRTSGDFYLGQAPGSTGVFGGQLDEVSLYRRALNPQEIYEIYAAGGTGKCPPGSNAAPFVYAGLDTFVTGVPRVATLQGYVSDDGQPAGYSPRTQWNLYTGPGTVAFGDATALNSTATFSTNGIYVLQLTADDGSIQRSDLVEVRVESLCTVEDPNGLAAWWPGNGTEEDVLNGVDSILGSGTSYSAGNVAGAFRFDGTNDYVWMLSSSNYDVGASPAGFTIEFWMKPSAFQKVGMLGWANGVRIERDYFVGDGLRVRIAGTGGTDMSVGTIWSLSPTNWNWTHIAVTYDRASGLGRIYTNGVQAGTLPAAVGTNILSTAGDFYLGQVPGSSGDYSGLLDEVSLYRRPLNPQEIYEVYASGSVGKCPEDNNQGPLVDAGHDVFVVGAARTGSLQGTATDDGLPVGSSLRIVWSPVSGPGGVSFGNSNSAATTVTFSTNGIYVLQLTADDGSVLHSDRVEVRVESLCTIEETSGLAAWWPGNRTAKEVVSGTDAYLAGGTGFADGRTAAAFSFDGTSDFVQAPTNYNLRASPSGFSVEFWMKPTAAQNGFVMGWTNGIRLERYTSGTVGGGVRVYFTGLNSGSGTIWATTNWTWTHIALTYDPASGIGRLFTNGVLALSASVGASTNLAGTSGDFYFGQVPGSTGFYAGLLDEVTLYRRALNPQEIYEVYSSGSVGKCPEDENEPPLVYAGGDLTIASTNTTATLKGVVADDGLPAGSTVRAQWSLFAGPGGVNFGDTNSPATTATFSTNGIYVLQLTADDGSIQRSDLVEVRVATPCVITDPSGLLALWPGNGTAVDRVSGTSGLLAQGATYTSGKVAAAFQFDGANDYVQVPVGSNIATNSAGFTLEFWAKPGAAQNGYVLGWTNGVRLERYTSGTTGGGLRAYLTTAGNFGSGALWPATNWNWTHIAVTYDRAAGQGRIFTNGVAAGAATAVGTNVLTATGDLFLGQVPGLSGIYAGALDEVNLYNRPLTATEILAVFNAGAAGKCVSSPNAPPVVHAGPDRVIYLPTNSVTLNGGAGDDGLPTDNSLAVGWTYMSGPSTIFFSATNTVVTTVTFTNTGVYTFRLTANDGQYSTNDTATVTVLPDPRIAPVITLTSPANNSIYEVSSGGTTNLNVTASVTDADGNVTNVTFLLDGVPSGTRTAAPWAVTISNVAPAAYTLSAIAADNSGLSATSAPVRVIVYVDQGAPLAELILPEDAAFITAPTNIIGTASSAILESYTVRYRFTASENAQPFPWVTLATGTTSVVSNTLAIFDPTLLMNGIYQAQVTATDLKGRTTSSEIQTLMVSRNLKIGHFTMAFSDLTVPLAGVPIEVVRTYDSRDQRTNDFGVGWSLDIRNVRLQKTRNLGVNWNSSSSGGWYSLDSIKPRRITVTIGERAFEFESRLTPSEQYGAPIASTRMSFTNLPGTYGTLEIDGENRADLSGFLGFLDLIDIGTGEYFNPARFKFTTAEGDVYVIDEKEGLKTLTDRNTNTLTITTNGIFHSSGVSVAFGRDAAGRIQTITDPAGNVLHYGYGTNGMLSAFTDRQTNTTTFAYTNAAFPHYLTEITDPRGVKAIRTEFDATGRMVRQIDGAGNVVEFTHDLVNNREIIRDRLGNVTVHEYDERGNVLRTTDALNHVTTYTFDAADNQTMMVDALGNTNRATYDNNGNKQTETDPLGYTTRHTYGKLRELTSILNPRGFLMTNSYDSFTGELLAERDALGQTNGYTYDGAGNLLTRTDALGNVTSNRYDNLGRMTSTAVIDAVRGLLNATTFTYDTNGNQLTKSVQRTVSGGGVETLLTRYAYDKENRLVRTIHPDGSTNTTIYALGLDKPAVEIDPLGRQTLHFYDARGNETNTVFADLTSESTIYDAEGRKFAMIDRGGRTTIYTNDALGRVIAMRYPDGAVTNTVYDAIGRIVATVDERGNTNRFDYDPNCGCSGRKAEVIDALGHHTHYEYDQNANQTSMLDALGRTVTYFHDALDRRTNVFFPDGSQSATTYDALGRRIAETDQSTNTTWFAYDALGRLVAVTNALGKVTSYTYDELGSLIAQTDANNHTTTFEYDRMGRRTKRTLPGGQVETYAYDLAGNLTSKTDFNGRTTTFGYDPLNRLLSKTPDAAFAAPAVTFTYTATGQRATMSDASGVSTYAYNSRDWLTNKTWLPVGQASSLSLNYAHDSAGNLTRIRSGTAGGADLTYSYDALNRLETVVDPHTGTTTYGYDAVGNLAGYVYPNNVATAHAYDLLNRLTNLSTINPQLSSVAWYRYTVAPSGHRLVAGENVATTNGVQTINRLYTYDATYRLVNESVAAAGPVSLPSSANVGYALDDVGNRTTRTSTLPGVEGQSLNYDANDRLTTDTYDANGNTTAGHLVQSAPTVSDAYEFEDRLINRNSGQVVVVYDGDGNRVAKTAGGVTTLFLVDDRNPTGYAQVLEEITVTASTAPVLTRVYAYGHDLISQDQLLDNGAGGFAWNLTFYGYDGHGNVRYLTGPSGTVTDTFDFDAFGTLVARTGTTPNAYLYCGEQFDADLGLYYNRARYLNADSGRFWTRDVFGGRIGDPISLHKYLGVGCDPVNQLDPSGYFTMPEAMISSLVDKIASATRTINAMRSACKAKTAINAAASIKFWGTVAGMAVTAATLPNKVGIVLEEKNYAPGSEVKSVSIRSFLTQRGPQLQLAVDTKNGGRIRVNWDVKAKAISIQGGANLTFEKIQVCGVQVAEAAFAFRGGLGASAGSGSHVAVTASVGIEVKILDFVRYQFPIFGDDTLY